MTNQNLILEIDRLHSLVSAAVDDPALWTLAANEPQPLGFRWVSALGLLLEAQAELQACRAAVPRTAQYVTDEPADALGVPYAHIGLHWCYFEPPTPGDLVWADHSRLARLLLAEGVPHLRLADGTQAPAEGRVIWRVDALMMPAAGGYAGNLLVPVRWPAEGVSCA